MRYSVITFGCRVNQADSQRLDEELRAAGGADAPACEADLVVINSCSVTAAADQGARQTIRRIARENPAARIVVTGCYATRRPDEVASLPGVVTVLANDDKLRAIPLLESVGQLTTAERFGDGLGACGAAIEPGAGGRTAFTLRVQTGCEEQCSYCIIPTTRGPSRSVPVETVVGEVRRIVDSGFKEITLTGVHLGSYGRDLEPRSSLMNLLEALARVEGDVAFRVSSLEPMDCPPELADLIAASDGRFAPHLHLPLQHASDRMLALMRRPYTLDRYRRAVERIVDRLPHVAIGSDIIVGFPGETDRDVAVTLDYLLTSPLSHLHVFPYSDRPGTEASRMAGKVPGGAIRERGAQIRAAGATLAERFRESQCGSVRPGLTLGDGTLVVTDNFLKVRIPHGHRRNERVAVRIESTSPMLVGSVVQ